MFQSLLCALRGLVSADAGRTHWRALFDDWLRYASYSSDLPLFSMTEVEWYLGGIQGDAPFPDGSGRSFPQKTGDT